MSELKTKFWLDALKWRAESGFAALYVIRRGDEDAGAVLVKVAAGDGSETLYVPVRDENGQRIWLVKTSDGVGGSAALAQYCQDRLEADPDLWLVEIEDREGRHFLTEPVEKP